MGFQIYQKDTIEFEAAGHPMVLTVNRLSAKKQMQFSLKVSRLQDMADTDDPDQKERAALAVFALYVDLLSAIVVGAEGFDDLDEWPTSEDERRSILESCGASFVTAAVQAYNAKREAAVNGKK